MRRALATVAVAAAAVAASAGPAGSQEHAHGAAPGAQVSMQFVIFAPNQLDVLAGDTVRWTNDSVRAHDIVARDQSFDSGRVVTGGMFERRYDAEGSFPYYCSIHPTMTGAIDVHRLLLERPAQHGAPNRPFVLAGRSAVAGANAVTIEADEGAGFHRVADAPVGSDGGFRVSVVPRTTTTYRAVAADAASPPVQLLVEDHSIAVASARHGRTTTVSVRVTPAAPHQVVALQLRLREHFGWWTVHRARLDHRSRARFAVRRAHGAPARAVLTLADGWTELARSRTFRVPGAGR